ncbi:hypothetical protein [Hydrogenophaga sp.]|uniref:hypothetical protein n=1 Tax=Hydrogenophaga sp. TaxID=1904254 RepID=UPI00271C5EE0|nr:hypothetical protein [Hydrogenophaga sp.]MDO9435733.1 hypothetical protein [Hydrogenophaga sp.]
METVLGSGEAINVAVVVRAASGPCKIRQSVSPDVLMTLFGTAGEGEGVAYMVGATVIALQKQMDEGVTIESLGMPFDGFALCECRDCAVRDMSELFSIGVKLSTAFGVGAA